jgi:hypothetical protein
MPIAISVGNVINVPPPASALTAPATAATNAKIAKSGVLNIIRNKGKEC